MTSHLPHISVCVCTYKRPTLLRRCLDSVCEQRTEDLFSYSIVVCDNDVMESARDTVEELAANSRVAIKYCVEPRQNIARTRNKAVHNATGDLLAFIDDDEFTTREWLLILFRTLLAYDADGVLGPVNPHFEDATPKWVIEGRFYDRPMQPTGMGLPWNKCRTGNVLLKRSLFGTDEQPFDPACLSGEDQDFFRRKGSAGASFVWCHEAPAYEAVPPLRWKRSFLVRRALFRGIFAQRNHGLQPLRLLQALVSMPLYTLVLPLSLAAGQAKFMTCLFKLSYHTGRVLGFFGVNPIRQAYVVE
jgi:succinoglycan biosynthesis protein ExoM